MRKSSECSPFGLKYFTTEESVSVIFGMLKTLNAQLWGRDPSIHKRLSWDVVRMCTCAHEEKKFN